MYCLLLEPLSIFLDFIKITVTYSYIFLLSKRNSSSHISCYSIMESIPLRANEQTNSSIKEGRIEFISVNYLDILWYRDRNNLHLYFSKIIIRYLIFSNSFRFIDIVVWIPSSIALLSIPLRKKNQFLLKKNVINHVLQ